MSKIVIKQMEFEADDVMAKGLKDCHCEELKEENLNFETRFLDNQKTIQELEKKVGELENLVPKEVAELLVKNMELRTALEEISKYTYNYCWSCGDRTIRRLKEIADKALTK